MQRSNINFEIDSKVCLHSFHPEHGSSKVDEAGEVAGAFGVTSGDGTIVLEPVEEALDAVALGVQGEVRVARLFDTGAWGMTALAPARSTASTIVLLSYPLSAMTYGAGNPVSNGSACVQSDRPRASVS